MQSLLRTAARRIPRVLESSGSMQTRAMSGHSQAQSEKDMKTWRTISAVAIPVCFGLSAYVVATGDHHHADVPKYPYLRIRSKEFPWGDCSLFDLDCEK